MWRIALSSQQSFRFLSMRSVGICRYSTAGVNVAVQTEPLISKEVLLKMRKETGYSYVKCRKALVACGGEQNYEQALRWIKEAAVKEGWDKAAKLSGRKASQGLIGFASLSDNVSVLVELNCETDFVARSAEFKNLVTELVNALRNCASELLPLHDEAQKLTVKNIELDKFRMMDGRTANEAIVATVSKVGENIQLARASVISSSPANKLFGQTHPKEEFNGVQLGRFISLVSLGRKSDESVSDFPTTQLGQVICQHIIGMAPESLGEPGKKGAKRATQMEIVDNGEVTEKRSANAENESDTGEEEDLNASQVDQSELTRMDGEETQLLHQPFMLNPEQTVNEYLEEHGASFMKIVW
ncbi:hypothetical protein niasHS_006528 [Heterodera schachtii]|uniref:Elongation factor Ts, mitochondrial n=1 Tax=Heterodera schachtii TaxID=97005 RepID=A0ABD2JHK2_HETSC